MGRKSKIWVCYVGAVVTIALVSLAVINASFGNGNGAAENAREEEIRYPLLNAVAHGKEVVLQNSKLPKLLEGALAEIVAQKPENPLVILREWIEEATSGEAFEHIAAPRSLESQQESKPPATAEEPKLTSCPAKWAEADGACFIFVEKALKYEDADKKCRELHRARLAIIESQAQNDAAAALLGDRSETFIGLRYAGEVGGIGELQWSDGRTLLTSMFQADWNDPTDAKTQCTRIIGAKSTWKPKSWDNWDCNDARPFLCSITLSPRER
eukprot:gb/GFBE01059518.1/.p1 GENE.gb/GFBE01059518.1/~~gb/GFBE01059518.1/.p1  ORF type:complete len:270 (+),score=41.15 gb/GFBE01059518.1/:1-810(+)